jgi:hypothetical protein
VFEGHGGQQEALMPDAPSAPVTAQPWYGLGGNAEFYEGTSAWPNGDDMTSSEGAPAFAAFSRPFYMFMGHGTSGPAGHAGPSNVGKGPRRENRSRR